MLIAADYPFFDLFWTIVVFFAWLAWIWIAVTCFIDIFRRDDIGGGHKALWVVFIIVIPFLGVLVYLIAQHDGMRDRSSTGQAAGSLRQYVKRPRAARRARLQRPRSCWTRARSPRASSTRSRPRRSPNCTKHHRRDLPAVIVTSEGGATTSIRDTAAAPGAPSVLLEREGELGTLEEHWSAVLLGRARGRPCSWAARRGSARPPCSGRWRRVAIPGCRLSGRGVNHCSRPVRLARSRISLTSWVTPWAKSYGGRALRTTSLTACWKRSVARDRRCWCWRTCIGPTRARSTCSDYSRTGCRTRPCCSLSRTETTSWGHGTRCGYSSENWVPPARSGGCSSRPSRRAPSPRWRSRSERRPRRSTVGPGATRSS